MYAFLLVWNLQIYLVKGDCNMIRRNRRFKKITGILLFFVFANSLVLPLHSEGICDEALSECALDALVSLIFGGPHAFAFYSSGCLMGYTWCLKYVEGYKRGESR
jgi:hypothetical protein